MAVDQKATSASWGGGMAPWPPLDPPLLLAYYVTVVEGRPIMSVKYYLPGPVFHFWP